LMQVWMEISGNWILWALSRQHARTHSIVSWRISGEKVHSCASTGSLFSRFVTLWFYLFPIWQRSGGCNWHLQDPNRRWLPILPWEVENSWGWSVLYQRDVILKEMVLI
jgi:hypothetical protein